MHIFLDLDGVLADFDRGYEDFIGAPASKELDNVDWSAVAAVPGFYRRLPATHDAHKLVGRVLELRDSAAFGVVVLSGVPKTVPGAAEDKRIWLAEHFPELALITCPSRDKAKYGAPGDVLIDDWEKYRHLWLEMGGIWITHRSAELSLQALSVVLDP